MSASSSLNETNSGGVKSVCGGLPLTVTDLGNQNREFHKSTYG